MNILPVLSFTDKHRLMMHVGKDILEGMQTNANRSVRELSDEKTVMLVFLRHFGCTFCRAGLAEIAKKREEIESQRIRIVFVHMSEGEVAERYFEHYDLAGSTHVSDPACRYYQAFGLMKGTPRQLFGLNTWIKGFKEGVVNGHGLGKQLGDAFQMPGVFLLYKGEIRDQFIHRYASDQPDYDRLLQCCMV